MLALLEAKKAGLFQSHYWAKNIIAGIIVGVVSLPLAMAFAIASGAKPEQGLYTEIIAGFFVAVFGGTRLQIAGPTGAFIVILSGITAQYGIEGLQIATLMAGVMLFIMGMTKIGSIVKYIPESVVVGFTAGIGIVIWVSQWRDFFGLPSIHGDHFHTKLLNLFHVLPQLDLTTTSLAISSLILVIYSSKIAALKKIPGPLVALIAATLIQVIFKFDTVNTIGTAFGGIPQGLPEFNLPELNWNKVLMLLSPAFSIALLGAIESLLSAVVADKMAGTRHNSNQELIGQGLANIATPLFGGFAATGAIARTATNFRNGGTGPLSGIVHSITLLIILLVLAPWAVDIPLAALAAILFVVAWNMSHAHHFIQLLRNGSKIDILVLLSTFVLTIFVDLITAVVIGVVLSILGRKFVNR